MSEEPRNTLLENVFIIILGIIIKFFYLLELICMLLNLHVLEVI